MDAVLPMGCSSSCAIFECFSTALEWAAKVKLGVTGMVHVIDDFLLLAHSVEKCSHDLMAFVVLCKQIGVPLTPSNTVGPSSSIPFVGIILDAVHMEARLPDNRLERSRSLLLAFQSKQKVTLKELQSLISVLNFACHSRQGLSAAADRFDMIFLILVTRVWFLLSLRCIAPKP